MNKQQLEMKLTEMIRKVLKEENKPFVDDNIIKISEFKNKFRIISRTAESLDNQIDGDIDKETFDKSISIIESSISYIRNKVNERYRNM